MIQNKINFLPDINDLKNKKVYIKSIILKDKNSQAYLLAYFTTSQDLFLKDTIFNIDKNTYDVVTHNGLYCTIKSPHFDLALENNENVYPITTMLSNFQTTNDINWFWILINLSVSEFTNLIKNKEVFVLTKIDNDKFNDPTNAFNNEITLKNNLIINSTFKVFPNEISLFYTSIKVKLDATKKKEKKTENKNKDHISRTLTPLDILKQQNLYIYNAFASDHNKVFYDDSDSLLQIISNYKMSTQEQNEIFNGMIADVKKERKTNVVLSMSDVFNFNLQNEFAQIKCDVFNSTYRITKLTDSDIWFEVNLQVQDIKKLAQKPKTFIACINKGSHSILII